MLKKDILYTAITRASKSLSLIGEPQAFIRSIESTQNLRNTALKERLQSDEYEFTIEVPANEKSEAKVVEKNQKNSIPEKIRNFILTPEMVESSSIDAMIGMDGVKP